MSRRAVEAMSETTTTEPAEPFELRSQTLGSLPIVCHFLARMGASATLERYLGAPDARVALAPARAVGVLVRNLCVCHQPLYGLGEWAAPYEPALVGLSALEAELLNDDRVGRSLDRLFDSDRASLLTELVLGVIDEFGVDCTQLHNDSTSITLHGAYEGADGRERGGKPTPKITHGHSKDHRPDLKQLLWILTVAADGAVPLAYRLADGNTTDDRTHIETWDGLRALTGRRDFLYVADSKLATREQMEHIDRCGGRFVTVLPRSRAEDGFLREWVQGNEPDWTEAERRAGKRKGEADEVWWTAPAPAPTAEGYRIVWVRSSGKRERDAKARAQRIERAHGALEALAARLRGPKTRLRERVAVCEAAQAAIDASGAERWVKCAVTETVEESFRQEKRGRPGRDTRYRRRARTRFGLEVSVDAEAVAYDAASDGCFPLVSNDRDLSDAKLLAAYRYQPNLEKRHHGLKGVQEAAPVFLKSPARIEGLFCCHFIALLCCSLIERELRGAMAREGIEELPLYPEGRPCRAPTAARVLELFSGVASHRLVREGELVQTFEPELTPLQAQLLDLLGVPSTAYASA